MKVVDAKMKKIEKRLKKNFGGKMKKNFGGTVSTITIHTIKGVCTPYTAYT